MSNNILSLLKERELISHVSDYNALQKVSENPISVYCGFDPTADSLHIGHLLPLISLKRFQMNGHRLVLLIGGATSLIGDPSFKKEERNLSNLDSSRIWQEKIRKQLVSILEDENYNNSSFIIDNNLNWFKKMNCLDFLREVGKRFSINKMISKKSVQKRISREDFGISFAEFSYSLLQAYDFCYLYKKYQVILQIGGADQWGNISSGIELVRKFYKKKVFGLTTPLLIQPNGIKFGKTEKEAIWLDSKKTSPYKFYQFWINILDENIFLFLNYFTFLEKSCLIDLYEESKKNFSLLKIKEILASNITEFVHGKKKLEIAKKITHILFFKKINTWVRNDFLLLKQSGIPITKQEKSIYLQDALVLLDLSSSKTKSRNLISSGAVCVNSCIRKDIGYKLCNKDKLLKKFTLISRGKRNYGLLVWKS